MEEYKRFALQVLLGEVIAGEYIIKACKRYLDYFDREDIYFDTEAADRVVNFIEKLKHFTGSHNGKPFILQDWQKWVVYSIFGWKRVDNHKRLVKNVYLTISRKNGKSALAAAIALYCLVADKESNAEIELVANNRKQASITYDMCYNFLGSIDKKNKYFKKYRDTIKFDRTKSKLQVLSSDASGLDGFNASCFICDEVHSYTDSKLYDVMKSSQGMREQPLGIIITTSGFNLYGFCKQYEDVAKEVVSGIKQDDTLFAAIFQLDEGDAWDDEKVWRKSNPNLGVTVQEEYLKEQIQQAKNNGSLEVGIRTKNLNQWCSAADIWIPNDIVINASQSISHEFFVNKIVYVGVDLSAVSDITAVCYMTVSDEGIYYFKTLYYLPESVLFDNVNSELYKQWKREKYLIITPGNVVDYDYILKDMIEISQNSMIDSINYDSWNATQFAINATTEGLPLEPYSQTIGNFNRPTKEFERLMRMGRVVLDNNPITRWMIQNVKIKEDYNGNAKPIKAVPEQKIDGVIAKLEALGGFLTKIPYNNEIYTI